jgi:hypothetical protein
MGSDGVRSKKRRTLWQIFTRQPASYLSPEEYRKRYKKATGIDLRPPEPQLPAGMARPIRTAPKPPKEERSPEKGRPYRFFANPFVQGVGVVIALAVAFSGKLDQNGTVACIVVAAVIGSIGIWSHSRQKVLLLVIILAYCGVLWRFEKYLTTKEQAEIPQPQRQVPVVKPKPALRPQPSKQTELFLNCETVGLPIGYPAFSSIYVLDSSSPNAGLVRLSAGSALAFYPSAMPETWVFRWGYRCDFLNYEKQPIFSISTVFKVSSREVTVVPNGDLKGGIVEGAETASTDREVQVSLIDAHGKFEFFIVNSIPSFMVITPSKMARGELKDKGNVNQLEVRMTKGNGWEQSMTLPPSSRPPS